MANDNKLQNIIAHCKEYGFVFQSSEIYDGLSAVYDYGQYGAELKRNIRDYWWRSMTQMHENIVGIDAAIFMHPTVWKASGHVDNFSDPMIDNKDSQKRYRVDHLIEGYAETLDKEKGDALLQQMDQLLAANDFAGLKQLIDENKVACAISGTCNWTEVRQFNLMFSTEIGSVAEEANVIYLRPETAQGIFVNFLNVQKTGRMKIPFGIAQTGKAFRNEIVARGFIFRMREFEQMEMQFFIHPKQEPKWFEYWKQSRIDYYSNKLGIAPEHLRFHQHGKDELAHYAINAFDIEFLFPMGWQELEGIHSRSDYDLRRHKEFSGDKQEYLDQETQERYLPYVIETSAGLTRSVLMVLTDAYEEEVLGEGDVRTVLHFHPNLAPVKVAVMPVVKKDGLLEIAQKLEMELREDFATMLEPTGNIGKNYRRQDEIGTPYCVTVDHTTKEDNTVTIRYRDSMKQERVPMAELVAFIRNNMKNYKRGQ